MLLPVKFLHAPILCYVTDRKSLASSATGDTRATLIERIGTAAAAGIDWIQIREKGLSGKDMSLLVRESLSLASKAYPLNGHVTRISVNDRCDVALAERAGGVHLGERSLQVGNVSQWLSSSANRSGGQDFLVGVSCHSIESAVAAARDGADYIFFGPVFSTPSKAAFGAPQGLQRLKEVCNSLSVPVLAIGGITVENTYSCVGAGASGIAAIRMFQDAADLPVLLRHLRAAAH